MFASLAGLLQKPDTAVRIPNDSTTFNPKEYPNLAFAAKGKVQGMIRLVHGTEHDQDEGLGTISIRVWVHKEGDQEEVLVKPVFHNKTLTVTMEVPSRFGLFSIYHETTIHIPRITSRMISLHLEAASSSFLGEGLEGLHWDSVLVTLSNATIAIRTLFADSITLHTSNARISGAFDAGHIGLITSNAAIAAKMDVRDAYDGRQSRVVTSTSNAPINLHINSTEASHGLRLDASTKNGKIVAGILLGKAKEGSKIRAATSSAKIELNLDASQSGQPLEANLRTNNGSIDTSIMVPRGHPFLGVAESGNGDVNVNLSEQFQGRFQLDTSNASATVEGSDLSLSTDKHGNKHGTRGNGLSDISLRTSNAATTLRFYPEGDSLAA